MESKDYGRPLRHPSADSLPLRYPAAHSDRRNHAYLTTASRVETEDIPTEQDRSKRHLSRRQHVSLQERILALSIDRKRRALIASVSRSVEFFKTAYFRDATWNAVNLIIWSCVEPGASLIVACLLALPKLLSTILKDGLLSSLPFRSRRTSQYQNFLDQPRDERLLKLRSMSQPKDKHGFALDDDAIALRPWGEAISKAERGEVSKPRPEDKDRIYVQKQISVHSDNRES